MNTRLRRLGSFVMLTVACFGQQTAPRTTKPTYSISGRVIDAADGQPISNAEIYVGVTSKKIGQESLLTSSDGRFRVTDLPAGKYGVLAAKRGYVNQAYGHREAYVIGIAVGPGVTEPDLILRLQAEGSIAGIVLGDDDAPINHAEISLFRSDLVNGLRHIFQTVDTTTDEGGSYRFSHLSPGKYYLAVKAETEFSGYLRSASQYPAMRTIQEHPESDSGRPTHDLMPAELDVAYPVTFFPDVTKATEAQNLVIHAGEKLRADFHLHTLHAVHVKLPSGTNAAFLAKSFEDDELAINAAPIPSPVSAYTTLAIAPGLYSVSMEFCGQEGCVSSNPELDLTADATIEPAQIVDTTTTISGTATTDDGAPDSSGTMIVLTPYNSTSERRHIVFPIRENGKLEWSGMMPPGRYTVALENTPLSIKKLAVDGGKLRGTTIEKRGTGELHLSLVLTSGGVQVRGKVLSAGNPVAGAMVLLVPEDFENNIQLFRRDESDSDGTFALAPAPQGNYIAIALQDGWELEWGKPEVLKPYLAKGKPIRLAAGKTADIILELQ